MCKEFQISFDIRVVFPHFDLVKGDINLRFFPPEFPEFPHAVNDMIIMAAIVTANTLFAFIFYFLLYF